MKKLILSILFIAAFFPIRIIAQVYQWTSKADYGGGEIYDPFSFTIGNKAYTGTGRQLPGINRNDFWEYDPGTDIWTQKSNFPGTGRYGAKGFSIGQYGYAGTGWDPTPTNDFYRYDPISNTWIQIANFAGTPRYTSVAFSINNKGYLGLGYAPCKSDFWQYDPGTNAWSQVASFPGGSRQAANSFTWGNTAFVGLGVCETSVYNDWWKYNGLNNTWTPVASFPGGARSSALSFVLGDSAFVGFGNNAQNNNNPFQIFDDLWKYDINSNAWSQQNTPPVGKRFSGVAFAINGSGYIGMGTDTIYNTRYLSDFWRYGMNTTVITPTLTLNGTALLCAGSPPVVITASPSGPGYFYQWYSNGIASGGLTTSNTFTAGGTMSVHVQVSGNNVTGVSTPLQVTYFTSIPPKPGTITGLASVCPYQQGLTYSVNPVQNATGYVWTVPPGVSILGGQGTNAITVNWGNKFANVAVIATNPCGSSAPSKLRVFKQTNCRIVDPGLQDETENSNSLTIYPNPADTKVKLIFEMGKDLQYNIEILDLSGKLIERISGAGIIGQNEVWISTENYPEKIYLVCFNTGAYKEYRKIMIRH